MVALPAVAVLANPRVPLLMIVALPAVLVSKKPKKLVLLMMVALPAVLVSVN